jgi:hypothetical protein
MNNRRESLDNSLLKYQFVIDDLQNKLNDAQTNNSLLETQLSQLKLEKKQLRNFAIQLKGQLDSRNIVNNTASEDKVDTTDNIDTKDDIGTQEDDTNDANNDNVEDYNIYKINDKSDLDNNENTILDSIDSLEQQNNDLFEEGEQKNDVDEERDPSWRVFKANDPSPVDAKGVPIITEVKRDSLWF